MYLCSHMQINMLTTIGLHKIWVSIAILEWCTFLLFRLWCTYLCAILTFITPLFINAESCEWRLTQCLMKSLLCHMPGHTLLDIRYYSPLAWCNVWLGIFRNHWWTCSPIEASRKQKKCIRLVLICHAAKAILHYKFKQ